MGLHCNIRNDNKYTIAIATIVCLTAIHIVNRLTNKNKVIVIFKENEKEDYGTMAENNSDKEEKEE